MTQAVDLVLRSIFIQCVRAGIKSGKRLKKFYLKNKAKHEKGKEGNNSCSKEDCLLFISIWYARDIAFQTIALHIASKT
jgi:hypothetical protein